MTLRSLTITHALALTFTLALMALLAGLIPPLVENSSAATAQASARCNLSAAQGRKLGATYVTSLSVVRVGCAYGKKVVKLFNACRHRNGGKAGRCKSKVRGFRCTEKRTTIPTQISAKVRCTRGSKRVSFRYEQFT